MTAASDGSEAGFGQGHTWRGSDPDERAAAIEAAFDYRGDVTLELCDGEQLSGYVANRDARSQAPFLDLFEPAGGRRRVRYDQIAALSFTGKDTAAGKSWESWVRRWKAKKAAQARGEEVGEIGLFPEALDD